MASDVLQSVAVNGIVLQCVVVDLQIFLDRTTEGLY